MTTRAFELVDTSSKRGYYSDCHTAYVLVTGNEVGSPEQQLILDRQQTNSSLNEQFFIVSVGEGTATTSLQTLACNVGGVLLSVPNDNTATLKQTMLSFFAYHTYEKTLGDFTNRQDNHDRDVVWAERYTSIPNIWGDTTSAVVPVYDKTNEPWRMLGVASVDVVLCEVDELSTVNETEEPSSIRTVEGCSCLDSFTWRGESYKGCTNDDWSVPWCGTQSGCGVCGTDSVGPTMCWDDCTSTSKKSDTNDRLLTSSRHRCETTSPSSCQLEAFRSLHDQSLCGALSGCNSSNSEINLISESIKLPNPFESQSQTPEWAVSGNETSFSTTTLTRTDFESSLETCACDDTQLLPECSCSSAGQTPKSSGGTDYFSKIAGFVFIIVLIGGPIVGLIWLCFWSGDAPLYKRYLEDFCDIWHFEKRNKPPTVSSEEESEELDDEPPA